MIERIIRWSAANTLMVLLAAAFLTLLAPHYPAILPVGPIFTTFVGSAAFSLPPPPAGASSLLLPHAAKSIAAMTSRIGNRQKRLRCMPYSLARRNVSSSERNARSVRLALVGAADASIRIRAEPA